MKCRFLRLEQALAAAALLACGSESGSDPSASQDPEPTDATRPADAPPMGLALPIKSPFARLPPTPGAEVAASADLETFAWAFYGQARSADANFVYSPYSIAVASAILSETAAGNTLLEIQSALHFSVTGEPLHVGQNALGQALLARNRAASGALSAQTLRLSHDFWISAAFNPRTRSTDPLSQYYDANLYLVPFASQPEPVRQAINEEVRVDTGGLIDDLLPIGSVDSSTLFVLTSALYFASSWASPFSQADTVPAPFSGLDGSVSEVPMMRQTQSYPYLQAEDFQMLSLPYDQGELEMVFVVPDQGAFDVVVSQLQPTFVEPMLEGLRPTRLDLSLPRFEVSADLPLAEELMAAGMRDAFSGMAEFPVIGAVRLDDAFHRATLIVDEQGTVAAATAALVGDRPSGTDEPVEVRLDRPFVFFIRDVPTGAVLYVGQYVTGD